MPSPGLVSFPSFPRLATGSACSMSFKVAAAETATVSTIRRHRALRPAVVPRQKTPAPAAVPTRSTTTCVCWWRLAGPTAAVLTCAHPHLPNRDYSADQCMDEFTEGECRARLLSLHASSPCPFRLTPSRLFPSQAKPCEWLPSRPAIAISNLPSVL